MESFIFLAKYGAYLFVFFACFMRKELYMRLGLLGGSLLGLIYVHFISPSTYWIDMGWLAGVAVINLVTLILMYKQIGGYHFRNKHEEALYKNAFHPVTMHQFKKIVGIGEFVKAEPGEMITEIGKPVSHLYMICDGLARVVVNGQTIAFCHPGNLVGEMSFITKAPASATVYIVEPTVYIQWTQAAFRHLLESDPDLQQAMQTVFNADFFRKHKTGEILQKGNEAK